MNNRASGFMTFFIIFLLASMTLFFLLSQRIVSYASSLAHESSITTQQDEEFLVTAQYALALVAHRFYDLNSYLAKTGKPLVHSIQVPELKKAQLEIRSAGNLNIRVACEVMGTHQKKYHGSASVYEQTDQLTQEKKVVIGPLAIG